MELLLFVIVGILFFYLFNRSSRPKSQWLIVDARKALLSYDAFLKLVGMGTGLQEKEYAKWTKDEKRIWGNYPKKYTMKMRIKINYLASEDSYLIQPMDGMMDFFKRKRNCQIYSAIIAGDESMFKPYIEFQINERTIKGEPVFTICFIHNDGFLKESHVKILCEFPIFEIKPDSSYQNIGFEVKRSGGDDAYKDYFGEMQMVPLMLEYKKNGVTIERVV